MDRVILLLRRGRWKDSDLSEGNYSGKLISEFTTHEIGQPQRLRFDIEVSIPGSDPPKSDKITDVVNYEYLLESVEDSINGSRLSLLESLGSRILDRLMIPLQVSEASIKITKMDVLEGDAKFGCEMTRKR